MRDLLDRDCVVYRELKPRHFTSEQKKGCIVVVVIAVSIIIIDIIFIIVITIIRKKRFRLQIFGLCVNHREVTFIGGGYYLMQLPPCGEGDAHMGATFPTGRVLKHLVSAAHESSVLVGKKILGTRNSSETLYGFHSLFGFCSAFLNRKGIRC